VKSLFTHLYASGIRFKIVYSKSLQQLKLIYLGSPNILIIATISSTRI